MVWTYNGHVWFGLADSASNTITTSFGDTIFSPGTTGASGKYDLRLSGTTLTIQNNTGSTDGFYVIELGT